MTTQKDKDMQREITNINKQISRLSRKIRDCCGLSRSFCVACYQNHWKVKDLKEKKEKIYKKLRRLRK